MPQYEVDLVKAAPFGLTRRELEVLCLAAEGLGSKDIGVRLRMKDGTARYHLSGVRRKLGAESTGQAIGEAVDLGILRHQPQS
jgi:two-component system, NarL family, response regulator DesR